MVISAVAIIAMTALCFVKAPVYNTQIMSNGDEYKFDNTYSVSLGDPKYGDVEIQYMEDIQDYVVMAEFKRGGTTTITLESPSGEKTEYDLVIEKNTYEVKKK